MFDKLWILMNNVNFITVSDTCSRVKQVMERIIKSNTDPEVGVSMLPLEKL